MPSAQSCWKTSTSRPYAAPTESRLSSTAVSGMTIERNVASRSTNARPSTNANTHGMRALHLLVEVVRPRRLAGDGVSTSASPPTVAGSTSSRSVAAPSSEASSSPLPAMRDRTSATVWSGLISSSIGANICARRERLALQFWIPACTSGLRDVSAPDDDLGRRRRTRERGDRLVGLHDRQLLRHVGEARELRVHRQRRSASASRARPRARRERRPPHHAVEHEAPEARLAAAPASEERDASLVDAVAELREQRRQDRERADHGASTTSIVPPPSR